MYVVFDTNAYRTLVMGKSSEEVLFLVSEIVEKQKNLSIVSLMSTTVARELICHIYDGDLFDENGDCTKAIRAMYAHCGDMISYGMVPLPETQLTKELFDVENKKAMDLQEAVSQIVYNVF